jgi:hypothetical protein
MPGFILIGVYYKVEFYQEWLDIIMVRFYFFSIFLSLKSIYSFYSYTWTTFSQKLGEQSKNLVTSTSSKTCKKG